MKPLIKPEDATIESLIEAYSETIVTKWLISGYRPFYRRHSGEKKPKSVTTAAVNKALKAMSPEERIRVREEAIALLK